MASIISVDTLQDSAGSNEITTANVKTAFDDRVKAWINFNGEGTIATRDSLNVSSITDNATGKYTIDLSNNMDNGNYSITIGGGSDTYYSVVPTAGSSGHTYTTSTSQFKMTGTYQGTFYDLDMLSALIFGDLA